MMFNKKAHNAKPLHMVNEKTFVEKKPVDPIVLEKDLNELKSKTEKKEKKTLRTQTEMFKENNNEVEKTVL